MIDFRAKAIYAVKTGFQTMLNKTRERISIVREDPFLGVRELNKRYHSFRRGGKYNTDGADIFEEDWDNLILLDGCRYDTFDSRNTIDGSLETRQSRGSNTHEFLVGNVLNRELEDTVYITANPMYYRHRDELNSQFHDVINVWLDEGWDNEYNTVLPETTTRIAKEAANEYKNKRLVIHYIQPHAPFISDETDYSFLPDPNENKNVWTEIRRNSKQIDLEEIIKLYEGNFDKAISSIETLVEHLEGKTVITSDHGNMIGERSTPIPIREWGHPRGIYTSELITVPWLVLDHDQRREITREPATDERTNVHDDAVEDRLSSLGYLDA